MKSIALAVCLLVAGCATAAAPSPTPTVPPAGQSVKNRDFLSTSVTDNGTERPLAAGTRIRLHFAATDLSVSAGCNIIGGSYLIEDDRLLTDSMSMTEMGCDPPRDAQDQWLVAFIGSRPLVRLDGNELVLETDTTKITLLDREVAEPDLELVGPTWTLTSVVTGDAVSSIPDGIAATLAFLPTGELQLAPGCNQGSGRWVLDGGVLVVTDIGLTKMACMGAAGQVEAAVLAVLQAPALAVEIEAGVMTLSTQDGRGLQLAGS